MCVLHIALRDEVPASIQVFKHILLVSVSLPIDNQRNGLETQAKALMTSVIRPDTLYFGTL